MIDNPNAAAELLVKLEPILARKAEWKRREIVRLAWSSLQGAQTLYANALREFTEAEELYHFRKTPKRKTTMEELQELCAKRKYAMDKAKERYEMVSREPRKPLTILEYLAIHIKELQEQVNDDVYEEETYAKENGSHSVPGYLEPVTQPQG